MATRRCDCTVGFITDPEVEGSHKLLRIGCAEYRAVLKKALDYHQSLNTREGLILSAGALNNW
jgi:hypothetical protein